MKTQINQQQYINFTTEHLEYDVAGLLRVNIDYSKDGYIYILNQDPSIQIFPPSINITFDFERIPLGNWQSYILSYTDGDIMADFNNRLLKTGIFRADRNEVLKIDAINIDGIIYVTGTIFI